MITCEVCGHENPSDASTCVSCGCEGLEPSAKSKDPFAFEARLFRALIVVSIAAYIPFVAVGQFYEQLAAAGVIDENTANALSWAGYGAFFWPPDVFMWLMAFLSVAASVGVYRFSWPARLVFSILIPLDFALIASGGLAVGTAFDGVLWYVVSLADGAVLAMAWTRPLGDRFTHI